MEAWHVVMLLVLLLDLVSEVNSNSSVSTVCNLKGKE